jgi:hypothetical protein
MPTGLVVKVGNFGFPLTFTIYNADGTLFNLTSLYETLYVYTQEQQPTLLFSGACTSTAPATGVCTYTVQSGNFPEIGVYNAEIEMTDTQPPTPPVLLCLDTETFNINVILKHPAPP